MGLEKLHLKHISKGWQLRQGREKSGEVYRTKAEAIAAAEKMARRSKNGLLVVVEPREQRLRPNTSKRAAVFSGAYFVKNKVPLVRYPIRNPAKPETIAFGMMEPAEKAESFRNWADGHSKRATLVASTFERESFYEDHD